MIREKMTLLDPALFLLRQLAEHLSQMWAQFSINRSSAAFGNEDQGNRAKKSTPNETCQVVVVPTGNLATDAQGIFLAGRF